MKVPSLIRRGMAFALLAPWAAPALAHNGYPDTTSVTLRQGHPEEMLLGATFGAVITHDGGASWHWICPQALGIGGWSPESYLWQADGTLMAATGAALIRSKDGGCTWAPHPFFTPPDKPQAALWPKSLASLPSQPSRLWVSTGRPGQSNALYRSDDGGETFTPTALQSTTEVYPSVKVAPSDPRRLYVSASTPTGPRLYRSDDEGLIWRPFASPFPENLADAKPYDLFVLRVSDHDPDRLWARISAGFWTYVLESRDGGQSFRSIVHPDGQAEDGIDETLMGVEVSEDGNTLWAATPTRLFRVRSGETFATLLSLPTGNACVERTNGVLFVCGASRLHDWALATTPDEGLTYTPLLDLPDMRPSACPVGTPARDVCQPLWPQIAALVEADPLSTPSGDAGTPPVQEPPPAPPRKGCSATEGLLPAAMLLALPLLRRARRS
ncbi:BNR/Asp-box repeat domain protein [Cystobacter fuscus]|uniref:BNR/Asp-box repeat domain protein n=1 Tax=Cystobacter fuscus TaxID=43 RepID=A0A250ITQ7_9BACT|nr:sialidase family protein [Cystobacter fuscus]ATB35129.1 BNR/Asp-box repeat domain protein [Cystobacter fuscus]